MNKRSNLFRDEANQHQRFGLRKLSIGVASVLLGTAFFLEGPSAVQASKTTETNDQAATTTQTTSTVSQSGNEVALRNQPTSSQPASSTAASTPTTTNNSGNQSSVTNQDNSGNTQVFNVPTNTPTVNPGEIIASEPAIERPSFTGTVQIPGAKTSYSAGDTQEFNYRLSTTGATNISNPQFLLMLPTGFEASASDMIWSTNSYNQRVQDLGQVGPNHEQTFLITLDTNPTWPGVWIDIRAARADTTNYGGQYAYGAYGNHLVYELSQYANPTGDGSEGGGTATIHMTNGTTYQVSRYFDSINDSYASFNYSLVPGSQKAATTAYDIDNVHASLNTADGITHSGNEQLTFQLRDHNLQAGDYIDVYLGLPHGNGQVEAYDTQLADSFNIPDPEGGTSPIGRVYNMGDHYRLVFNDNITRYRNATIDFDPVVLQWGQQNHTNPSINPEQSDDRNLGKVFVYQNPTDPTQGGQLFAYSPTNDVNFNNDKFFASGYKIQGQYVITNHAIHNANASTGAGSSYSTNRTWDSSGNVSVNTDWSQSFAFAIATRNPNTGAVDRNSTSNNFDFTISVGKNPLFNYNWMSDSNLATAIKNLVAPTSNHSLSDQVTGTAGTYLTETTTTNNDKPTTDVTVTHSESDTSDRYVRTYHINISNPDVYLSGSITPLIVTAYGLTMPTGINSYAEDVRQSNEAARNSNYGAGDGTNAVTSNTALEDALRNTPIAVSYVHNNTDNRDVIANQANWMSEIHYNGNSTVNGGIRASDYLSATMRFEDVTDPAHPVMIGTTTNAQGRAGETISFGAANGLLADLGTVYTVQRVTMTRGGHTSDITSPASNKNDLSQYNYGTFGVSTTNGAVYTVEVTRSSSPVTDISTTIHYVDVTSSRKTSGFTPSDGTLLDHNISEHGTTNNEPFPTALWSHPGYTVVQQDPEVTNGVLVTGMNPNLYVYLRSNSTPATNVSTTVHYIDVTNSSKTSGFVPSDGNNLGHNIAESGADGADFPNTLWNYSGAGYTEVAEDSQVTAHKLTSGMPADLYVYLRKNTTSRTVRETIHYIYDDAATHRHTTIPDGIATETMTGTLNAAHTGYTWEADGQFPAVVIPTPESGYYVVSATRADNDSSVLSSDRTQVEAITPAGDVVVNVHFAPIGNTESNVIERITYVNDDGTTVTTGPVTRTLTFTRPNASSPWSPTSSTSFSAYTIVVPSGYHVVSALNGTTSVLSSDKTQVNAIPNITGDSNEVDITIHLAPNDVPATVNENVTYHYDDNSHADTTHTQASQNFTHHWNDSKTSFDAWSPASVNFAAFDLTVPTGYHVVSATDANGNNVLTTGNNVQAFSGITNSSHDVDIIVHLAPNDETSTVNEEVTYIYDDNSQGQTTHNQASTPFTHHWNDSTRSFDDWSPATASFAAFGLNVPTGYHIVSAFNGSTNVLSGPNNVSAINGITHSSRGVNIIVHLAPNNPKPGETKTINEAVTYVYDDGSQPTSGPTIIASIPFTRTNGGAWSPNTPQQFNAFNITIPNGYHVVSASDAAGNVLSADSLQIVAIPGINAGSSDVNVTVHLERNGSEPTSPTSPTNPTTPTSPTSPTNPTTPTSPTSPTNPTTPTSPTSPTNPTNPTSPTSPSNPTSPNGPVQPTAPVEPNNGQTVQPKTTINQGQIEQPGTTAKPATSRLPQTGNNGSMSTVLSLAGIGFISLLGLGLNDNKRHN